MPEDVDPKPRELENEPKEPWPVWWGFKNDDPGKLGWWVTVGLPLAFYSAVAALVFWAVAIAQGHTSIPMLLFWIHLPLFMRLWKMRRDVGVKWEPGAETRKEENPVAAEVADRVRTVVEDGPGAFADEARYARPEAGSEYRAVVPLLFGEDGLETMRHPVVPWSNFSRYEYVGESGGTFVIRLVNKTAPDAAAPQKRPGFWHRVAGALPGWVTFWIFLGALDSHGWRSDTLAAFFAVVTHTLARAAFRKLGEPQPDSGVYLVFDSRVVTTGEAFSRLNRYLQGAGEAA